MDALAHLAQGFGVLLQLKYLGFCLAGVLVGQVIGALPGIGPSAAIAILLPLTFGGDATGSIIMFAGIYYGAQYGGTLTSVLVSIPGESSTVMTSLDGYQMARKGRAGAALGMAAIASFIAGTVGTLGLMLMAPPLAAAALYFGPPEYFALVLVGLTSLSLVGGGLVKGLMMGLVGLMIATIGVDPQVGNTRFMFGQLWLMDGIDFLVLAVALFGVGEVLASVEQALKPPKVELTIRNLMPTDLDWIASRWAIVRGTLIGFVIGVLPGAGATIASFMAYAVEKKVSKHPEKFGTGVIEGVAAPEAANNAAATGAMVPMFALGIPGSGTTAVMLGALIMFGLQPGPQLFEKNADLVWGVIASMYVGNCHPARAEPAAGGHVRHAVARPLYAALPGHPGAVHRRRLQPGQQCRRPVGHERVRRRRLFHEEVRLPHGAAGARPGARAHAGNLAAPVDDAVARQPCDLRHAADSAALVVLTLLIVTAPLLMRLFRRAVAAP